MKSSKSIAASLHSDKYRADIDGLRAIAVTSVVVCHAYPALLPGGFVGVDIFFVLSGYLISSIIMRDLDAGRFSIKVFYERRIRRIFPALITVLLASLAIGWLILARSEFQTLGRHVTASTLFAENFQLWSESGYFDTSSERKPLLHLWSLAIEEQFYVFWPLILWGARRVHAKFFIVLCLIAAASFIVNLFDVYKDPTAAYYSPLGRFWELMVGSGLAYAKAHHAQAIGRFKTAQSIVGAILLIGSLALTTPESAFPGFWALAPTFGTALLISSGEQTWLSRRVLSSPPFVWGGLISYPLYLWHWPLLAYCTITFGVTSKAKAAVLVGAAIVAATITFLFIERPFRSRSKDPVLPLVLVVGMVLTLGLGAVVAFGVVPPRLKHLDVPSRTEWDFLRERTKNFDRNGVGTYQLHPERTRQVLFIGDSHVAQYAERIDKVIGGSPANPGAVMMVGGACNPIPGASNNDVRRRDCLSLRADAYAEAASGRFKTIVIGGAWNWYFLKPGFHIDSGTEQLPMNAAPGRKVALGELESTLRKLVKSGNQVYLLLDNPISQEFNPSSTGRLKLSTAPSRARTVRVDPDQRALLGELKALGERAGARVIDPFSAICPTEACSATTPQGQPIYKDHGHLNPEWAVVNAKFIDPVILSN
jgi:peptidoglycan/LPS O-acetylase OafA/YrhL